MHTDAKGLSTYDFDLDGAKHVMHVGQTYKIKETPTLPEREKHENDTKVTIVSSNGELSSVHSA